MTINFDLAIFTVLIFAILLAVLWKFAWGPISAGFDLREQKIADNIAAAEQCNVDAKHLLAEYEAKLAAAREEVRGILDEARRDAEHAGQELIAKARADAQAEVQRGKHEIETATSQGAERAGQEQREPGGGPGRTDRQRQAQHGRPCPTDRRGSGELPQGRP